LLESFATTVTLKSVCAETKGELPVITQVLGSIENHTRAESKVAE